MLELVSKPASASRVVTTHLVLPSHTNSLGSIFGGTVMSWIDIAAAIAAQRHSSSEVVTASVDQTSFVAPVYKGWVVNIKASVNFVSKTSMEVGVRVDAENPRTGETFHTASSYLTFVAIDPQGKPKVVPRLIPESDDEKRRFFAAQKRREQRLKQL
ncbi:MAG TPA: acyl-CoA thioesterase [Pseudobdellovibrionaceae bacterium]|nr:acyl-CoA thioesterase [Pseudobdellovibrionaceae bacterium]